MADNVADFLTFISPICILVLFFMCFFRFLFRSCECGSRDGDDLESCPSSRPNSSTTARIHPICQLHPEMNSFGEFIIHCPAHCEETFPPKYEDALKMAVCSARSDEPEDQQQHRRLSIPISSRPSIASPPPFYSDQERSGSRQGSAVAATANELPPSYTMASQTIFQPIIRIPTSSRRESLTLPTTILSRSPLTSAESSPLEPPSAVVQNSRISIGEIYAQIRPASSASNSTISRGSPISLLRVSSAMTSSASSRTRDRPPRVHLPGAVIENEEEEDEDEDIEIASSSESTLRQSATY